MPTPRPVVALVARTIAAAMAILLATALVVGVGASPVHAHNTLLSSDPADGAVVAGAPPQITWVFGLPVPLDTMTVTLIAADGSRTELAGSTHGPGGEHEVVTPLPALADGAVTVRWRLVGADGHAITGRVGFEVAAAAPSSVAAAPGAETSAPSTLPGTALPDAAAADPDGVATDDAATLDDAGSTTPAAVRWILRYASYLAILTVVGVLLTTAFVSPSLGERAVVRRALGIGLVSTAVLGALQLLVLASDVAGEAPWSALDSIGAATTTDAGIALALRVALALTLWVVLFATRVTDAEVYWTAVALPSLGLLATWAFAGHASSMRWPAVGVTTDVIHHAAAAAWIAGLAIVAWIVVPSGDGDTLGSTMRRFSGVAATCVALLVVTGLVQSVRLVGGPGALLDADHGRYLVAKLVGLAAMLSLAAVNRRRLRRAVDGPAGAAIRRRTPDHARTTPPEVHVLRRAVAAEFAIGLVIIAITAAMVVSPPATAIGPTPPPRPAPHS